MNELIAQYQYAELLIHQRIREIYSVLHSATHLPTKQRESLVARIKLLKREEQELEEDLFPLRAI